MSESISKELEIEIKFLEYPYHKITDTPTSTRKKAARRNILLTGGVAGIKADELATPEEYAKVTAAMLELQQKLQDTTEEQKQEMKSKMGIEESDMIQSLEELEGTRQALEQMLFNKEDKEREKDKDKSPPTSEHDSDNEYQNTLFQTTQIKRPLHTQKEQSKRENTTTTKRNSERPQPPKEQTVRQDLLIPPHSSTFRWNYNTTQNTHNKTHSQDIQLPTLRQQLTSIHGPGTYRILPHTTLKIRNQSDSHTPPQHIQ